MASALSALPAPSIAPAAAAMLLALMLAGCDGGAPAPAGGISKGEAEALADAAEMLDETRRVPDEALPETAAPPDAQPSAQTAGDTAPTKNR